VAITFPWSKKNSHRDDPYWDFFINTPPADLGNSVVEMIRKAPEGNIFPAKTELHTPEITTQHVKGMAEYFGAAMTGIAKLDTNDPTNPESLPFAVLCAVRADYDPRKSPGIGGQVPVQNGLFITFVLSAWIRELGYRATAAPQPGDEKLAARAGLGKLNSEGRLVSPQFGVNVYVANAIRTDLPLASDG
jgi:hypothetical protein